MTGKLMRSKDFSLLSFFYFGIANGFAALWAWCAVQQGLVAKLLLLLPSRSYFIPHIARSVCLMCVLLHQHNRARKWNKSFYLSYVISIDIKITLQIIFILEDYFISDHKKFFFIIFINEIVSYLTKKYITYTMI